MYLGDKCAQCVSKEGRGASGEQDDPLPDTDNELLLLD